MQALSDNSPSRVASHAAHDVRWFLVQAKTGREHYAAVNLQKQGYKCFVPTTWRSTRHARKQTTKQSAYFPGYFFVSFSSSCDVWRPIDGTRGVVRLVTAGGAPLPAPRGLVETLIQCTGRDGVLNLAAVLRPGDKARVTRGAFVDQLVTVNELEGPLRVHALLSIMNRTAVVTLSGSDLALAAV